MNYLKALKYKRNFKTVDIEDNKGIIVKEKKIGKIARRIEKTFFFNF